MAMWIRLVALATVLTLSACGGGGEEEARVVSEFERAIAQMRDSKKPQTTSLLEKASKAMVSAPASGARRASALQSAVAPSFVITTNNVTSIPPISAVAVAVSVEQFLDWVQAVLPDYFPGDHLKVPFPGYTLRYYPKGNSYIAVKASGEVYVYFPDSPIFGGDVKFAGMMESFDCKVDAETCRPRVIAALVTPKQGEIDVPMRDIDIEIPFDPSHPIVCPTETTTGTFGEIQGTLTCTPTKLTMTVDTLPANKPVMFSLKGYHTADGYEMASFSSSFTTIQRITAVVTANWRGYPNGASIVNPVTKKVVQVALDETKGGFLVPSEVDTDNATGCAYIGSTFTNVLNCVDVRKEVSKVPSFMLESQYVGTGVQGIAHNRTVVAVVTGVRGGNADTKLLRNRFIAFDKKTGEKVFDGGDDFLGDSTMIPTKLLYSRKYKKFYILMATDAGYYLQTTTGWNLRDSFRPGTRGMVLEINAVTYAKERSWNVGSMPIDAGENGNILRVLNAGSKELSLIDLEAPVTTGVVTVDWSGTFLDLAHPIRLKMDPEYGVYYVTDWKNAVRVFKIATDQQIKSIDVVDVPVGLTLTDSSLWVATPKKDIWEPTGNSVVEIDRKTQEVKGRVTDPGMLMPGGIATYDTAQP